MADFLKAIPHVLKHEGGYASTPAGEVVNRGINTDTLIALGAFGGDKKKITPEQMEELKVRIKNMPETEAVEIYRLNYWTFRKPNVPNALEQITSQGVATKLLDMCVLAGTRTVIKLLQGCLGVNPDGTFGTETITLVNQKEPLTLIAALCQAWVERQTRIADANVKKAEEANDAKLAAYWKRVKIGWLARANWTPPVDTPAVASVQPGPTQT